MSWQQTSREGQQQQRPVLSVLPEAVVDCYKNSVALFENHHCRFFLRIISEQLGVNFPSDGLG